MLYLFTLVMGWFNKLLNFLFGKTKIFIVILAWFLIITGAIFLVNPEKARKKLLSHGFGIFKGYLRIFVIYLAIVLLSLSTKTAVGFLKFLCFFGVVLIVWSFFFLKKKIFVKLEGKFAKIPISALIVFAYIQILVGALMLIFQRRIW